MSCTLPLAGDILGNSEKNLSPYHAIRQSQFMQSTLRLLHLPLLPSLTFSLPPFIMLIVTCNDMSIHCTKVGINPSAKKQRWSKSLNNFFESLSCTTLWENFLNSIGYENVVIFYSQCEAQSAERCLNLQEEDRQTLLNHYVPDGGFLHAMFKLSMENI